MQANESITQLIQRLCAAGTENEVVEFKAARTNYDFNKLGKYFSALSNEANLQDQPQAWLVFGVIDKDKEICGTQFRIDETALMGLKADVANFTMGSCR